MAILCIDSSLSSASFWSICTCFSREATTVMGEQRNSSIGRLVGLWLCKGKEALDSATVDLPSVVNPHHSEMTDEVSSVSCVWKQVLSLQLWEGNFLTLLLLFLTKTTWKRSGKTSGEKGEESPDYVSLDPPFLRWFSWVEKSILFLCMVFLWAGRVFLCLFSLFIADFFLATYFLAFWQKQGK